MTHYAPWILALVLAVALLWVTVRPRQAPAQAPSRPVGALITADDLDAALGPFRTRLATLEAAVESQEGKIARARQLTAKERREEERAELAERLAGEAAKLSNGASQGGSGESEPAKPRSRFLARMTR